jgi:hypothetical protein
MSKFDIWYMRPGWFGNGIAGTQPDKANLEETHALLRTIVVEGWSLDKVFEEMQAEKWSPNGEARSLIESKGLAHTSMSVGDVIVQDGEPYAVLALGFAKL